MGAKVVPIGQPVNDDERKAIAYLRNVLPQTYTIIHNFEIRQGPEVYEIDLAILAPHCVYLVDAKGTRGLIDIYGPKWFPEGRPPYHSPLAKLRQHAKVFKSWVCDNNPTVPDLRRIHVHQAVLMTTDDSNVVDHSGLDGPDVVYLLKSLTYFQDKAHVPSPRENDIRQHHQLIKGTIRGKAKPKSAPATYRDWQVVELLGGTDRYTEYRAEHSLIGKRGGMARLRIYQVDPYQDESARHSERNRIGNAFRAVAHMVPHPNILTVREFFPTENEDKFVLVTEDVSGNALSQHIKKPNLALTFDQRLSVMRQVLNALDHAHKYEVIHRNLTPDAILLSGENIARLTAFDYARIGKDRTSTIAAEIVDDLNYSYQAPECWHDPAQASIASDLFSAGLVFYELLVGDPPFANTEQLFDLDGVFPNRPSELRPDLPSEFDGWLQLLCAFDPEDRFISAAVASRALNNIIVPAPISPAEDEAQPRPARHGPRDYLNLQRDDEIGGRFVVQERLGKPGGFGVAYRVFDVYGQRVHVLKLTTRDRRSVLDRLLREYRALLKVPEHKYLVKVIWADKLADDTPYIVFEFVEGLAVSEMIDADALSLDDALLIARQTAEGLAHLHDNGVYHQDVKPSNLLWTNDGIRLIDFNVAIAEGDERAGAGGTRRYLPPNIDLATETSTQDKIDRDLYALGITFYECLTGRYPFDSPTPPKNTAPRDPRQIVGFEDLSQEVVQLLERMLAPTRSRRFSSAVELLLALNQLSHLRQPKRLLSTPTDTLLPLIGADATKPNHNPYVSHLLTLYSQSKRTNAGTRGLDAIGRLTYVPTRLDTELQPAVLSGEFALVIISGNAGDGKTAFIQQLENKVEASGGQVKRGLNGSVFEWNGRTFHTNHDGSQDEGDITNREVLFSFLEPYQGQGDTQWTIDETRIIAINEGRLIDFLTTHADLFPRLRDTVDKGLAGAIPTAGVAVINLNLRAVVADDPPSDAIFDRLVTRMAAPEFWQPCQNCDLKNRCYIHHNAQTFMDTVAGPKVIERLKTIYTLAHVRGRLHVTLRDLRSALAFTLVGTRDCDEVHDLYASGSEESRRKIIDSFYFNSWMGGGEEPKDRLLTLLREIDVGQVSNPELDRTFAFVGPNTLPQSRFRFESRGHYDDDLLNKVYSTLPRRGNTSRLRQEEMHLHRQYVATLRRRQYFERRDNRWRQMLPYRQAQHFLDLVVGADEATLHNEVDSVLHAINRGEGLTKPGGLGRKLALRVRDVKGGTIRSYRVFDRELFTMCKPTIAAASRFIEYMPPGLVLRFKGGGTESAELQMNLDIYEMLSRLRKGYRPTLEELQGFYLSLAIFKNVLSSAPYQEVLLTETGFDFHRITRDDSGVLHMTGAALESE